VAQTRAGDRRKVRSFCEINIRVNRIREEAGIMTYLGVLLLAIAAGIIDTNVRAEGTTLETARPVIVKTVPEAGSADVDPGMTEIKATFSKEMAPGSWSWTRESQESFPKMEGQPKYLPDKRTCVLPVKLEPGMTYVIWLNSNKFGNFKDASGRPAIPYLLVFKTK
jgi:RNA polymerase sigma-70 factor (ECF subfamily)